MIRYFFRRLGYGLLVLLGVVFAVFFLFQGFGDPSRLVIGQRADAATQENIRKELYLDQPRWKQFVYYLNDISPIAIHSREEIDRKGLKGIFIGGNTCLAIKWPYLRRSYQSKREVWDILMEALQVPSCSLRPPCFWQPSGGIGLGVLAAIRKDTWMDTSAIFVSVLGISAPSFFMGIVIAYLFGFVFSGFTGLHMTGSLIDTDPFTGRHLELRNLILPALTLGIRPMAIIAQLTRGACSMCSTRIISAPPMPKDCHPVRSSGNMACAMHSTR
jgi:peptide/nickel transport system permease protein